MKTPHLENREEFEAILKDYRISDDARQILEQTPFVLMVAPSASGRNTIINELLKTGRYYFIVSDTTRPPRINNGVLEQNGVEYFFRDENDMLGDIKAGRFLEAEVIHRQQVSGISMREIEKALHMGKIAIADVDIGGGLNIAKTDPSAIIIFILPPSFKEWLRRMTSRSNPSELEIRRRIETAVIHFKTVLKNDRFIPVINDNLTEAVENVDTIVKLHGVDAETQAKTHHLVQELLAGAEEYLKAHA